MTDWDELADWWVAEIADPAYATDVQPMLDSLLAGLVGPTLDLGCGEGRLAAALPPPVFGCDQSLPLLQRAAAKPMAVVQNRLPDLEWLRSDAVNVAVACLVLEHIPDAAAFFTATARVVSPHGSLIVVANHPAYTASGAGPVIDQSDGEVLWRWGSYFVDSVAVEPAGEGSVVFHHRPLSHILTAAAWAGWSLQRMIEAGPSPATIARVPGLAGQENLPRLIGMRWRL